MYSTTVPDRSLTRSHRVFLYFPLGRSNEKEEKEEEEQAGENLTVRDLKGGKALSE